MAKERIIRDETGEEVGKIIEISNFEDFKNIIKENKLNIHDVVKPTHRCKECGWATKSEKEYVKCINECEGLIPKRG